jgi:hypothetical protein
MQDYFSAGRLLIANVRNGHHFVLATAAGDDGDSIAVNDPGFDVATYSYAQDVVGWRIYDMKPCSR